MQNNYESPVQWSQATISTQTARFMSRVYGWMTLGVAMSGIIAYGIFQNTELAAMMLQSRGAVMVIMLLQFAAVITLTAAMPKLSSTVAGLLYFLYSALTGVTLSFIFLIYTQDSIFSMFFLTAFAFAGLSSFGFITKRELGPVGSFCMMGLFGMIGYSLIALFFPSMMTGSASMIMGALGVLVFSGLTAYDTQRIKSMYQPGQEGTEQDRKVAIYGALTLYLDFINLFLSILRIFGRRR